jgi:hypothetical protein
MSDSDQPQPQPAKRPWLRLLVVTGLLGVLAIAGLVVYSVQSAQGELQAAFAEADRLDPGWRLEEIEDNRAVIADKDNSALRVMAVRKLMPANFGKPMFDVVNYADPPPNIRIDPKRVGLIRQEMVAAAAALKAARQLKDFPRGRYPIKYSADFITTVINEQQESRAVAALLQFDVQLLNEDGKADAALSSCRAILNTGRALGDEPLLISQLIRKAECSIGLACIEQTLAQGVAGETALAEVQKLLADEEKHSGFLAAMRGERAGSDRAMESIQIGGVSGSGSSLKEQLLLHLPGEIMRSRALLFRRNTQLVEAAKLPPSQQGERLQALEADLQEQPLLVRHASSACLKVAAAHQPTRAQIRCAMAGVAAERYRLKHGRWPEGLEQLKTAGFLETVPGDPFTEAPLRLSRRKDGIVIYSVGPDGVDNRGNINRENPPTPGTDLGFQLWDVPQRRQPYRPPPPERPER